MMVVVCGVCVSLLLAWCVVAIAWFVLPVVVMRCFGLFVGDCTLLFVVCC